MSKVELLSDALDYIENNIYEDITADDVAKACYCSKSYLQKIFRYVNYCSIKEYIIKRRLTKAARDLVRDLTVSILDITLKYCYRSPEAFSRAFKQAWQCNPSVFRREARFTQLYPRQMVPIKNGQTFMFEEKEIPLSVYAVVTRFSGDGLKYDELFTSLHNKIKECK